MQHASNWLCLLTFSEQLKQIFGYELWPIAGARTLAESPRKMSRCGVQGLPTLCSIFKFARGHRKVLSILQLKQIIAAVYMLLKACFLCHIGKVVGVGIAQARPKWAENPDGTWGDFHLLLRRSCSALDQDSSMKSETCSECVHKPTCTVSTAISNSGILGQTPAGKSSLNIPSDCWLELQLQRGRSSDWQTFCNLDRGSSPVGCTAIFRFQERVAPFAFAMLAKEVCIWCGSLSQQQLISILCLGWNAGPVWSMKAEM